MQISINTNMQCKHISYHHTNSHKHTQIQCSRAQFCPKKCSPQMENGHKMNDFTEKKFRKSSFLNHLLKMFLIPWTTGIYYCL